MELIQNIRKDAIKASWEAGGLLEERLKASVSILCPATHSHKAGEHSPLGGPPYAESGEGMASIIFGRSRYGFEIGVMPTDNNRLGAEYGQNQLAFWENHGRPWLMNWREKYGQLFDQDFARALKRNARRRR